MSKPAEYDTYIAATNQRKISGWFRDAGDRYVMADGAWWPKEVQGIEFTVHRADWAQAPEGATHWGPAYGHQPGEFYQLDGSGKWWVDDGGCGWVRVPETRVSCRVPRPKPRWRGWHGGMRPIEGQCEVLLSDGTVLSGRGEEFRWRVARAPWGRNIVAYRTT